MDTAVKSALRVDAAMVPAPSPTNRTEPAPAGSRDMPENRDPVAVLADAAAFRAERGMPPLVKLIDLPGVADLEPVLHRRGALWLPENDDYQQRVDRVSVSLFGITQADTEFEPRDIGYAEWRDWVEQFEPIYSKGQVSLEIDDATAFWPWLQLQSPTGMGFDVLGHDGRPVKVLRYFARQMLAVGMDLIEGAALTVDGTGRAEAQPVDEWADALGQQAAEFMKRKR